MNFSHLLSSSRRSCLHLVCMSCVYEFVWNFFMLLTNDNMSQNSLVRRRMLNQVVDFWKI